MALYQEYIMVLLQRSSDDIEKEIIKIRFNQSKETWFEILYMVITGFGWICYGKEDSRKYKPY